VSDIIVTFKLGKIELPHPLGTWVQDDDGGWWEEHTPTRWLDYNGRVEREEPYEPIIRMFGVEERYLPGRVVRRRSSWFARLLKKDKK